MTLTETSDWQGLLRQLARAGVDIVWSGPLTPRARHDIRVAAVAAGLSVGIWPGINPIPDTEAWIISAKQITPLPKD